MMLFGEKYPDPVRMVSIGAFSKELCGGTHANRTDEIEVVEILAEESVASGIRRITAVTGKRALAHRKKVEQLAMQSASLLGCTIPSLGEKTMELMLAVRKLKKRTSGSGNEAAPELIAKGNAVPTNEKYTVIRSAFKQAARALNVSFDEVPQRLEALLLEQSQLHLQLQQISATGGLSLDDLLSQAEMVSDTQLIVAETPHANAGMMRQWIDQLRKRSTAPIAILLANCVDDKVTLIAGISQNLVERGFSAGKWIIPVAEKVGGGGGGKPDLAQAGGKLPAKLPEALQIAKDTWHSMLA
jgi:alanyl-tRNA synthetase